MLLAAALMLVVLPLRAATLAYEVTGIDGALEDNVRAYLGGPEEEVGSRREARALRGNAREKAAEALRALGYYEPTIRAEVTGDAEAGWTMTLSIGAGEPVRLNEVTIEVRGDGADDPMFRATREALPLVSGEVLNHGTYESAKSALRNRALSQGYFDYEFTTARIEVNTEQRRADIRLILATGPRYRISTIEPTETALDEDLVRRLINVQTPVPYSAELIGEVSRRLRDSGYFRQVRLNVQREAAEDGMVPVRVDLGLREPNSVGFGVGFSTDEGPRVRTSWERHWVNRSGHRLSSEVRASAVRQNASATYIIPLRDPLNDQLQFQVGLQAEDIEDSLSRRFTLGVQRQQNFRNGWRRVQSLRLLQERFEQADDNFKTLLLLPGLSFSRTRARGMPDPYWGDSQSYSLEAGHESLLSDISLARLTVSQKWLRNINRDHRFLVRFDGGAFTSSDFEQVPSSLRFFAGGDNSVRGFGYRTLAPENDDGELIGGRYLLTGSLEYSYPVIPNWRAAAFVDAGNAFNDFTEVDYKVGSGVGVRWVSPVGPVRLDLAFGVSEEDAPFRLHLSLGPPF